MTCQSGRYGRTIGHSLPNWMNIIGFRDMYCVFVYPGVDGVGSLLQIAAVCCNGWRAVRAWVSRPGRWAAGSHKGCGAAGGGSPLGVAV